MMLVAAMSLGIAGCGSEPPPEKREIVRPVKVLMLEASGVVARRSFPGTVRASERAELSFDQPGRLVELPIKQGDQVEAGQLLAKLDQRDFQSNVNAAQSEYEKARANFKRAAELIKKDFISRSDYDRIKAAMDVARSDFEKAEKSLEDTELKAPFAGVVSRRFVENFQDVQAKQVILNLQDTSHIELVVDVPERLVARKGQRGTVNLVALFEAAPGKEFPVTIKEFATQADPKTQTFEYVLTMPQPEDVNIQPGMTATVKAKGDEAIASSAFIIPALAVFADEAGQSSVWVIDQKDNTAHRRGVTTGDLTGDADITILEGLEDGEMIAITAVAQLREGMQIRPVTKVEY